LIRRCARSRSADSRGRFWTFSAWPGGMTSRCVPSTRVRSPIYFTSIRRLTHYCRKPPARLDIGLKRRWPKRHNDTNEIRRIIGISFHSILDQITDTSTASAPDPFVIAFSASKYVADAFSDSVARNPETLIVSFDGTSSSKK
jgi:hypothetical protein